MSLRQAGLGYDGFRLVNAPVAYNLWDADRIYGCVCDIGWYGADCSKRTCPLGDDPLTTGQLPEMQILSCTCGADCSGALVLSYAGKARSLLFSAVATAADETGAAGSGAGAGESVESVLESLVPQDTFASIVFSSPGGPLCTPGGNAATVTFNLGAGNAPQLTAGYGTLASSAGRVVAVSTSRNGTSESVQCSGRGVCDSSTGLCTCASGFAASNGNGGAGSTQDCGYALGAISACASAVTSTSSGVSLVCGGRGTCSGAPYFTCSCYAGYAGPACEQVLCPLAPAWFDEPFAVNSAHGLTECANRGVCNRWNGTCVCSAGFTGAACERSVCPTTDAAKPCSGNGRCLPLSQLASLGTVNGAPRGALEVQAVTCTFSSGSFTLSFLYSSTAALPYDATAATLKAALEALPTLGFVDVSLSPAGATSLCAGGSGVTALVTFTTDLGPQPLLVAATATPPGSGSVTVTRAIAGTRASYGTTVGASATWDAEMLYGCACDGYPDLNKTSSANAVSDFGLWDGPACSRRTCPWGSDPTGPASGEAAGWIGSENQTLACTATGGSFTLTFRGATSGAIAWDASADDVRVALESLPSVGVLSVAFSGGSARVCSGLGGASPASTVITTVRFLTELGNLPQMTVDASALTGGSITVATAADGTGTNEECAGRGICGECLCLPRTLAH